MRTPLKLLLITGSLVALSLGTLVAATAATTSAPSLVTSNYACSNGVCEVGPGNIGIAFEAELIGTGVPEPAISGCTYAMSVTSGTLPPRLQLWGTDVRARLQQHHLLHPTTAGTYPFTVTIQTQPNSLGQPGPSGTQKLTITIGTGSSDRLANASAGYNVHTSRLFVGFHEANIGALYSVTVTGTGKQVFAPQSLVLGSGGLCSRGTTPCSRGVHPHRDQQPRVVSHGAPRV
jgi:hypothetical protein